ncbi:hypothetical protein JRO89_XS03G0041500 [Xanthoceras sorbifolium]|uniref:Major facilitator superfamily (MFS) profile domain-containing protein n=1 Tax=Xanthoceras sorbifolium TaxID=99658 RepID=A0ABQ8I8J3_9ROSI|nr:hypothetical protein JRO89_XS03G0041500 [Xanthoceras sorbifolium]
MAGQQLQVLKALDVAKTQWYHFTAVVVAGMGFCTDASDLFCIPLLTKLLGRIYYHKECSYTPGYLPNNVAAAVIGVALCGTIAGQLFFGWLGFGIGVDHLLSVTIMSEYANKKTRGAFIAAVFTMQGFGILAGGMVAFLASAAFHAKFSAPINAIDRIRLTVPEAYYLWRIIVMFGAIPPALTYTLVMINRPFFGVKLAMVVYSDFRGPFISGFGILAGGMVAFLASAAFHAKFPAPINAINRIRLTVPEADYLWLLVSYLVIGKRGKGQQLQVLKALDVAKTQWYHFTAVVVAGMGFCTDASDLFCIPLLTKLLGRIYYHKESSYTPGYLPNNVAAAVIGVTLCGTIAGQLFFGWLGFGIGVDHLLSVTIMSEYANKKTRGAFIAAVFTMHGFGILAGGMVAFLASAAFHAKFSAPINAIDRIRLTVPEDYYLWRIIVMFGAIPPALTYTLVMINRPFFGVKLAMVVYSDFRGPFISVSSVVSHFLVSYLVIGKRGKGQQLQVLKALDVAKTQWYHFTAVVVAGMGFCTDASDLFCIPLLTKLLGRIYYHKEGSYTPGYLPDNVAAAVIGVALCGTIAGQLFFGWLGFGIGVDHLLSVTIMSEYANKKTRGAFIAAVFTMQGFGILAGGMVAFLASAAFHAKFSAPINAIDRIRLTVPEAYYLWRIIVMFGAIPPALTYTVVMINRPFFGVKLAMVVYSDFRGPFISVSSVVSHFLVSYLAVGQLFFGWLGDKMGRKRVYGITLMLVAVCSIASGLSVGKYPKAVMSTLCFFRFWLGFGIGGDYPLSAIIMSEYANKKTLGAFIAVVFAMHGFGILAGGIVTIIASAVFNAKFPTPIYAIDRIRSTVPEADCLWHIIVISQFRHRHGRHLLGTSSTWFLLGIAFYTHNLFQEDIFSAIGWLPKAENSNAIEEVYRTARAQIVIALCNTVPDYWFTVALIDKIDKMGRLRSSCHGISAATGKVGAMVGALGFSAAMHAIGLRKVFIVLGVVNFLGMMFTFLVPKSRGKSLEEMSGKADVETADAENGTSTYGITFCACSHTTAFILLEVPSHLQEREGTSTAVRSQEVQASQQKLQSIPDAPIDVEAIDDDAKSNSRRNGGRTAVVDVDSGQKLQVLNPLDVAKTQWYHFTAVAITGMGFFTDVYDLFCIPLVTKLLGRIYYHETGSYTPGSLPDNVAAAINGVTLCGFNIGVEYPLSTTIMSGYANKKTRGAFITIVFATEGFGILAGA